MSGSKIRGAFKVHVNKPAIYITMKHRRIADIYFALLHELAHCKSDFNRANNDNENLNKPKSEPTNDDYNKLKEEHDKLKDDYYKMINDYNNQLNDINQNKPIDPNKDLLNMKLKENENENGDEENNNIIEPDKDNKFIKIVFK